MRNVKLGKRSIDQDTFTIRTALDGATRLKKLKAEDVGVEMALVALNIDTDKQEHWYQRSTFSEIDYVYGKVYSPRLDLGGETSW